MSDIYDLGKINGFITMTELYSGEANTVDTTYQFTEPITDYKILIFFTTVNNGTYVNSNKNNIIVVVDDITSNDYEYRNYVYNGTGYYTIAIKVDNNSFTINTIVKSVSTWSNVKIYKVIGIK